jgi:hypothetical protein
MLVSKTNALPLGYVPYKIKNTREIGIEPTTINFGN